MAKYTIVEFYDGMYGVRVGGFWEVLFGDVEFIDLQSVKYTWTKDSEYFKDCKGTYEEAETVYKKVAYKCKPVKSKPSKKQPKKKMISYEEYLEAKAFYEPSQDTETSDDLNIFD